jgi:hypothetical protein
MDLVAERKADRVPAGHTAFVLDGIDDLLSQNVTVEKAQRRLARMADLQTGDEE